MCTRLFQASIPHQIDPDPGYQTGGATRGGGGARGEAAARSAATASRVAFARAARSSIAAAAAAIQAGWGLYDFL